MAHPAPRLPPRRGGGLGDGRGGGTPSDGSPEGSSGGDHRHFEDDACGLPNAQVNTPWS